MRLDEWQEEDYSRDNTDNSHANGIEPSRVEMLVRLLRIEKIQTVEAANDEPEDELEGPQDGEEDPDTISTVRLIGVVTPASAHDGRRGLFGTGNFEEKRLGGVKRVERLE